MIGRTFVLLCSVSLILLFGGCGKKNEVFVLQQFKSEVTVATGNTLYKGTVDFDGSDTVEVLLTYPQTLDGLKVMCSSDGTEYNLQDAIFRVNDKNAVSELWSVLSDIKNRTFYIDKINNVSDSNISYKIVFNADNKSILKIETANFAYSFYSQ